jgi:hypothetical protein
LSLSLSESQHLKIYANANFILCRLLLGKKGRKRIAKDQRKKIIDQKKKHNKSTENGSLTF